MHRCAESVFISTWRRAFAGYKKTDLIISVNREKAVDAKVKVPTPNNNVTIVGSTTVGLMKVTRVHKLAVLIMGVVLVPRLDVSAADDSSPSLSSSSSSTSTDVFYCPEVTVINDNESAYFGLCTCDVLPQGCWTLYYRDYGLWFQYKQLIGAITMRVCSNFSLAVEFVDNWCDYINSYTCTSSYTTKWTGESDCSYQVSIDMSEFYAENKIFTVKSASSLASFFIITLPSESADYHSSSLSSADHVTWSLWFVLLFVLAGAGCAVGLTIYICYKKRRAKPYSKISVDLQCLPTPYGATAAPPVFTPNLIVTGTEESTQYKLPQPAHPPPATTQTPINSTF
ncbi:hypothetical protein Pelo_14097 [Pelomyxa schiedti]|nr:hypothetical protein Pelo_14097 [Pelomyxa schiedti]